MAGGSAKFLSMTSDRVMDDLSVVRYSGITKASSAEMGEMNRA